MSSLLPWTSQRHLRVWHPVTTDSEPHDEATSAAEVHKKLEDYCSVCIVRIVVVGVPWLRPIRQHERQRGVKVVFAQLLPNWFWDLYRYTTRIIKKGRVVEITSPAYGLPDKRGPTLYKKRIHAWWRNKVFGEMHAAQAEKQVRLGIYTASAIPSNISIRGLP